MSLSLSLADTKLSPKASSAAYSELPNSMSEFTDATALQGLNEDFSLNDINGRNDTIASQEWSRMSDQFTNSGYREGIVAGKENALQSGFDHGFADTGAPLGRHLGLLRGLAAGLRSLLDSSKHKHTSACEDGKLHEEIAKVCDGLSQIQFSDIEPLDYEAIEHAKVHFDPVSTPVQPMADIPTAGHQEKGAKQLSIIQASLLGILVELGLGNLSELEYAKLGYMAKFAPPGKDASAQL